MEPEQVVSFPSTHLLLPLRKDILHRAVIYEGDKTRQGTASTKWRDAVHSSGRKLFPQKGTGRARAGDAKSPIRRGGGVAHGPHPRDFSTDLPRKVYDLAFRTALSHRYRQGELIVIRSIFEMAGSEERTREKYIYDFLTQNNLSSTMFVTQKEQPLLSAAIGLQTRTPARALSYDKVDVKNLLEGRQIVIEQEALESLFMQRQEDLVSEQRMRSLKPFGMLGFKWNQREWSVRPWNRDGPSESEQSSIVA
jgi:large subunit ribosomal protein L4